MTIDPLQDKHNKLIAGREKRAKRAKKLAPFFLTPPEKREGYDPEKLHPKRTKTR